MDYVRGLVVRVSAGKEKGNFFVILELRQNYAIISDGRHRPIEKAKKKNLKHLFVTNKVLSEDSMSANKKIRKALKIFYD